MDIFVLQGKTENSIEIILGIFDLGLKRFFVFRMYFFGYIVIPQENGKERIVFLPGHGKFLETNILVLISHFFEKPGLTGIAGVDELMDIGGDQCRKHFEISVDIIDDFLSVFRSFSPFFKAFFRMNLTVNILLQPSLGRKPLHPQTDILH